MLANAKWKKVKIAFEILKERQLNFERMFAEMSPAVLAGMRKSSH